MLYIYELPIDMVASSRKNKSRQGITIRKNQQPVSIDQSSNSHLNRTDSAHSNNVRSASNSYDTLLSRPITVLMCITVTLYQVIPRHLILQRILLLILPKSEPGQLQKKLNHCWENQKGYYLRNRNTGECSCCNSSQDD